MNRVAPHPWLNSLRCCFHDSYDVLSSPARVRSRKRPASQSVLDDLGDQDGGSFDMSSSGDTLDPRNIVQLLQLYGIDVNVGASASVRANECRKQKFASTWELWKASDVAAHFQSITNRLRMRNSERLARTHQLQQHIKSFVHDLPPCPCGKGAWAAKETRVVKVVELTFRHECSIPRYVQCSGCNQQRPLNPIELDYFPGNPEKEV
jgi:hypothetical protein